MGADFLCTSMPYAKITLEREQELKDIVDALNDDDDNSDVAFLRETTLGVGDDEPLDDIKKRLHEAVRIMEWDDPVEYRAIAICGWDGMDYEVILTGGMSWGDEPTDVFEDITILSGCEPIYKKLLQWAREDFAKNNMKKTIISPKK